MHLLKERPKSMYDEPSVLWTEDSYVEHEDSISEEDEVGSGSECELRISCRVKQEIWNEDDIWEDLHNLPDADTIFDLIQKEHIDNIDIYKKYDKAALLISAWFGKDKFIKEFLENGAYVDTSDDAGRTPLHLASCAGNLECLKILIELGASVTIWEKTGKITPLHCAASKGHVCCLKLLIKKGADVNAGLSQKSPLHYAVQSEAVECVRELLEAGAIPNTPQVFSEAPLHVAASLGSAEILKLLITHGASVMVHCGADKSTALHLAAGDGDIESVKILLEAGAEINCTNNKLQTPLHLAALSQSTETLEILLQYKANTNATDIDGRTALHGAIVKSSRSCDSAKLLLSAGANANTPDSFGYTPLHLAALNEASQCVMLLLNYGGDVTAKTNGGISVLTFITRRTPDIIPKYVSKLDSSIKLNDHEIGDVDCELKLDFRILVPSVTKGETDLLLNFIESGHREILKHPLCETFLFLKWRRIRKFFLFSLFYHALFVVLFTIYIVNVFLERCPPNKCIHTEIIGYSVMVFNFLLLCKEIFQIAHSWLVYIKEWENWLQWSIIIIVFCCMYQCDSTNNKAMGNFNNISNATNEVGHYYEPWQMHVAGIGIFLTWLELMMIVGRFPIFGLYIQMFTTVSVNFAKFLMAYACLLIAFGLSFGVLFSNYKSFHNLALSLLKTLIMMSGELEFEDVFYDETEKILYPWTAHIVFLAFVLLVTIILTNLMVGLAVSDIQGLQRSAGLDRLVRQAELVAHLESMLFSRLLSFVPKHLLVFFYKHALLLRSQYHYALYIKPNDPREEKIPKDIIKSIYKLVAGRRDKGKKKRRSGKIKDNDRYELVSRVNSVASTLSIGNMNQEIRLQSIKKISV